MDIIYQNYHKHDVWSNPVTPDSVESVENYCKRAIELGSGIISSVAHGWQGYYIDHYEMAKKYNLKFLFGTETYFVKDADHLDEEGKKDKTNAHIILLAKNENGRRSINRILSIASKEEKYYYYKTRIDFDLLLSLPKDDVWVTSACIAGVWKYEDNEEIIQKIHNHFGDNFFLEVQYHNSISQIKLNERIKSLSEKYGIKMIFGSDSHYIFDATSWERIDFLKSKGIDYEDEADWFMDFPSGEMAFKRFKAQNIFSDEEIYEFINNTNVFLDVEEYVSDIFNKDIKMPNLYPELTQVERDRKFIKLTLESWQIEKTKVPKEMWKHYEDEIKKEIQVILNIKHSDYFLLNYEMIKKGVEKGGIITPSGRGSACSYYVNKLLGFTKIDRISSPVKLYPERFMSESRMLEAKSMADVDHNLSDQEPFRQAQIELMGEKHSVSMIAFGTMKAKSAWQMYAKSADIAFNLANEVSKQIEKYDEYLKHHDEETDGEAEDIFEFIDEQYHEIFKRSEKYRGIISDWKIAPSAVLVYDGDIEEEIGLVKCKSNVCCIVDKNWGEDYKFLKSDLLKVSSIDLIYKVFERIGIPMKEVPDVDELLELCKDNEKVWNIYKDGNVMGVNQVEQDGTMKKVKRYAPKNISELSAFIAAVRPGFKSMYSIFESREHFDYGIPIFDNLIQTTEMPNSFVLYQEHTMIVLNYAGIPMDETYEIVKAISKKNKDKISKYKERMISGFSDKLINEENIGKEHAIEIASRIWKILEDSSLYAFNASHSISMAIDSLYGAYLKATYTIEFYEVFLNLLMARGEKDRANKTKEEALSSFGIHIEQFRFRQDNRQFTANKEKNTISDALKSIKGFGEKVAECLYTLKDNKYNNFVELLNDLQPLPINETQIEQLIVLKYFEEFGQNKKLLGIYMYYKLLNGRKQISISDIGEKINIPEEMIARYSGKKTAKLYKDIDITSLIDELSSMIEDKPLNIKSQAIREVNILGFVKTNNDKVPPDWWFVTEFKTYNNPLKPYVTLYNLSDGEILHTKIKSENLFSEQPFKIHNILRVREFKIQAKNRLIDGKWQKINETEKIMSNYEIIS